MSPRQEGGPAALTPFTRCQSLPFALNQIRDWERDRAKYQRGTVALGFDGQLWLVLVSTDLVAAAIPF
jgi:hypothetical protein